MAMIAQKRFFDWHDEIEELGALKRLKLVLDHLPDEKLMRSLEKRRGNGRNDYPCGRCGVSASQHREPATGIVAESTAALAMRFCRRCSSGVGLQHHGTVGSPTLEGVGDFIVRYDRRSLWSPVAAALGALSQRECGSLGREAPVAQQSQAGPATSAGAGPIREHPPLLEGALTPPMNC